LGANGCRCETSGKADDERATTRHDTLSSNRMERGSPIMFAHRKQNKRRDGSCLGFWHGSCCVLRHDTVSVGAPMARKYSKKASKKVERAMHERKRGKLRSGRSGRKVKSRKQAIAIGLSEARRSGAKVPKRRRRKSSSRRKRSTKRRA
jgi:hypothetical protein